MIQHINNLKLADVLVTQPPRKTGLLGYLICINSLKQFYSRFVDNTQIEIHFNQ
nr:unnamed protein product [Callosobruchus analis]